MTREEAIVIMENEMPHCGKSITFTEEEKCEAFDMVIAALKAEPCEDAVSREAVLNTLDTMDKALDENRTVEAYKELLNECYKELLPVTPKPKTGKWIHSFYSEGEREIYKCSECGRWLEFNKHSDKLSNYPFCHCGAKMKGEGE